MKKTLDERMKRKVYRAWAKFKRDFTKSKDYWYRIYMRFDRINTEAFFKKWKENSRVKMEMLLQEE